jgi:hypothetical protein
MLAKVALACWPSYVLAVHLAAVVAKLLLPIAVAKLLHQHLVLQHASQLLRQIVVAKSHLHAAVASTCVVA